MCGNGEAGSWMPIRRISSPILYSRGTVPRSLIAVKFAVCEVVEMVETGGRSTNLRAWLPKEEIDQRVLWNSEYSAEFDSGA